MNLSLNYQIFGIDLNLDVQLFNLMIIKDSMSFS